MEKVQRKHYIDNLRWACILLLVPFHAAMAWNCWGEGNYIWFYGSKGFSTFVILISPWYMSLLFALAGISARFSLKRRSTGQFMKERLSKLLLPLITGMLTVVALMTYLADCFHSNYSGNFFSHYRVFFTKYTDFTGYDGGWTPGHLWFLLYLFIVSLVFIVLYTLQKKFLKNISFAGMGYVLICCLAILPILFCMILNFGGKSIGSYLLIFLIGFYVLFEDSVLERIAKNRWISLVIMIIADVLDVYMFIWAEDANGVLNTIVMYLTCWFGILTLLGFGKVYFNQDNRITKYLTSRSFLFYIFHFLWLVVLQFILSKYTSNTAILYIVPVLATFVLTFLTIELVRIIPVVNTLFGVKAKKSLGEVKGNVEKKNN
jgi:hypothetical protein